MASGVNYIWVIITVALVTFILRLAPFILMEGLSSNQYLKYISEKMPVGVMLLLVVYTFINVDFGVYPHGIPQLVSTVLVLTIYWYTKNTLITIGLGIFAHLLLVNLIM